MSSLLLLPQMPCEYMQDSRKKKSMRVMGPRMKVELPWMSSNWQISRAYLELSKI